VAESPNFSFIGNVAVGHDISLAALKPHYDCILFAYGASKDRQLGIPGESTLQGIYSARAFVGWYNGLPEYRNLNPDLQQGEEAIVIGQGNVALDVARILLSDIDSLQKTDITEYATEALRKSRIKRVRVVGRRGPMQAQFTVKEVRELMTLPDVGFAPIDTNLFPSDSAKLPRAQKRITQLLEKGSKTSAKDATRTWELNFLLSPTAFTSSSGSGENLTNIEFQKMNLEDPRFDPGSRASPTGESTTLPASIAFRSIGYKSEPLPGFEESGIPFDNGRGILPNVGGRIISNDNKGGQASHISGLYASGWVKRGPTGVIATTMYDAFETADAIISDWGNKAAFLNGKQGSTADGWESIRSDESTRNIRAVNWEDWKKIDREERRVGAEKGKERSKFGRVEEMLKVLD
jgi:adrenodoxin-NADP+ reductase